MQKKIVFVITGEASDIEYLTNGLEAALVNRLADEVEMKRIEEEPSVEFETMTKGDRGAMEAIHDLLAF